MAAAWKEVLAILPRKASEGAIRLEWDVGRRAGEVRVSDSSETAPKPEEHSYTLRLQGNEHEGHEALQKTRYAWYNIRYKMVLE